MRRWEKYLDLIILFFASLLLVFYLINYYGEPVKEEECVDVHLAPSFSYEACYDAYSKNIFLGIKRGYDSYEIFDVEISFFDFIEKNYHLDRVPEKEGQEVYQIYADKNPQSLNVYYIVSKKGLKGPVCETPRKVFIKYCPDASSFESVEIVTNPLENFPVANVVEIKDFEEGKTDLFILSLNDREKIWSLQCVSEWVCSEWGHCENGIQRRNCEDINNCFIPTSLPRSSEYCEEGQCVEEWRCVWSACVDGFTSPECYDLNNCGTKYNVPQKLRCIKTGCVPEILCSNWGPCEINYNFLDLVTKEFDKLKGVRRRICQDKNKCARDSEEVATCFTGIDIYTKTFEKCGAEFVGIYNLLDDKLIARIEIGPERNPYLNIVLEEGEESFYCDHCYDGILNGDEEKIDCGGSCIPCREKYN